MKNIEKKLWVNFILPKEKNKLEHIKNHFQKANSAGSLFLDSFVANLDDLITYINQHQPDEVIPQQGKNTIYVFELKNAQMAGYEGVAERAKVNNSNIVTEERNGHKIEVALVETLPLTHKFCVIATEYEKELVTAFPGQPAPPFPNPSQTLEERTSSEEFWSKNILLRKV